MKIKQLKIKGFKSFANETVLDFNEGFTAIVGPNGSGKSNLIEAIRWVMGEQSAKSLRGGRMHDVIFSGTKNRAPLNFAQVELILDNEDRFLPIDFDEVSILRRISRAGESVYRINNQNCRLKDIVDLFLDSGLGKESFSVISQGQVESIFNAKPEDRRAIFEEVAGVFKYKTQKETARLKLEKTQENLDRVQDILYEIEKQVVPLKKQAEVAEQYRQTRKELSDLDIAVTVHQIAQLTEEQEASSQSKAVMEKERSEIDEEKNQLVIQLDETEKQVSQIDVKRQQLNDSLLELTQEIERNEATLGLIVEKKKNQEIYRKEKEFAISRLQENSEAIKSSLSNKISELKVVKSNLEEKNNELQKIEEQRLGLEKNPEEALATLRDDYLILMQDKTHFTNQNNYAEKELQKNKALMERLFKQEQEANDKLVEIETNKEQTATLLESAQQELNKLLKDHKEIAEQIAETNQVLSGCKDRLQAINEVLHRAKAEKQALNEMQENYTGYYSGVRAVMTQQNQLNGIVGTVAELIEIPKKFLIAIDTALGSSSQFIVTQNENSAQSAISYLKKTKKGRATFLPLTSITSRRMNQQVIQSLTGMPGFLGIASDIVQIDSDYKKVMNHLLGSTIIADDLSHATLIAKNLKQRYRVVTLDGDVISPGGSMTGGDSRGRSKTQPIFMQQEKQQQIDVVIDENTKTAQLLSEQIQENKDKIETLQFDLERINELGVEARQQEQTNESLMQTLEVELQQNKRTLNGLNFEISEARDLEKSLNAEFEMSAEKLKELELKVIEVKEQMDSLQSAQSDLASEKEALYKKVENLTQERQKIIEEQAVLTTEIRQLKNSIQENDREIEQLEKEKNQSAAELAHYSKEELLNKKKVLQQNREEVELNLEKTKEERTRNYEMSRKINRQIENLSEKLADLDKKINDLEVKYSRRDVRLDYLLQYIVEEYQVSYEDARHIDRSQIDFTLAQKQVKSLKAQLKALGPVNLSAIEEYQTVHERYEFLSKQQADLIEAKQKLFDTMDKMDHEVESRFEATFYEIKEQFAIVFPEMFGGGRAELQLTDPNNLLETGIEIIAQPPGKKLTRLSLLSGGERALTAISLLFAIIRVRPIPFCILDEVESSLDEANVSRFGSYIQNFEDQTQFIVITHRKGTMEEADRLYGVTMQEQGVSKLVSVSLKEAERMDHVV